MFEEINNNPTPTPTISPKKEKFDSNKESIKKLVQELGNRVVHVNRLEYYANSIPLGAFFNAISFILLGFYRCKTFSNNNEDNQIMILGIILIFGAIGNITAGILEFIKQRSFTSVLYLFYGFYFLTLYNIGLDNKKINSTLCALYGACLLISIPISISSIRTNLFYSVQSLATSSFFVLRCVGEGFYEKVQLKVASGVFECIIGFASLYICVNQLINEKFKYQFLPSFSLCEQNEIDMPIKKENLPINHNEKEN